MSYGPQMNGSQPYAPQQPYMGGPQGGQQAAYYNGQQQGPAGYAPQQPYYGDGKMPLAPPNYEGERFAPKKPKFRDPIFAILVLIVFAGFIALSVISLRSYSMSEQDGNIGGGLQGGGIGSTLNRHTAVLLMLACALAFVLSIGYIILVKVATTIVLEVTLALSVLANIAYAILLWVRHFTSAAIIFTIFAVLSIISYFFMRKRIPLAKLMLRTIIRASNEYKSTYVVAILGTLAQAGFSIWWAWTLVAVYQRFEPNTSASGSSSGSGTVIGLVVFLVFAWFWLSETLKNIIFATGAGVYGVWYYSDLSKGHVKHAALSSFKRATTYSLGSIAFGSLIVALLDLLRAVLSVIRSTQAAEGDMVGAIFACIAECCVACIDSLVQYFNRYAYINIALYGDSYLEAAKATWRLLMDRGITALINDSLVNIVFTIGAYVIAAVTSLLAYVYLRQTNPQYVQDTSSYFSVILLYTFGLALNIALALGSGSINVGVSTLFVGLAEDPQILQSKDPVLYAKIAETYPQVMQAIHA